MRLIPLASTLLALSACHASVDIGDDAKATGDNVHVAMNRSETRDQVSIQVPGLSANVTLPGIKLGGHIDMDGIALAPDTTVKTVDVRGDDKSNDADDDRVRLDFTNPGPPASLIEYYSKAATDAGYTGVAATASGVSATKGRKQFALSIAPEAKGSRGRIVMNGGD